jgi:hypothetical protein
MPTAIVARSGSQQPSRNNALNASGVPPPNMPWAPRFDDKQRARNRKAIPVVEGPWKKHFAASWR